MKFEKNFVKNLVNTIFLIKKIIFRLKIEKKSTLVKGLETGKSYDYFANKMLSDTSCEYDGFAYHSGLKYGEMIKSYPYPCQSPKNESWPLFLRDSGRK